MNAIRKRQLEFLLHIYRRRGLERQVLTGKIEGKRDRGRYTTTYIESLRRLSKNSGILSES